MCVMVAVWGGMVWLDVLWYHGKHYLIYYFCNNICFLHQGDINSDITMTAYVVTAFLECQSFTPVSFSWKFVCKISD